MSTFTNVDSILLIGVSGAGKTAVGNELAKNLGKKFIDSDKEVEKLYQVDIELLIKNGQESIFRELERMYLVDHLKSSKDEVFALAPGGVESLEVQKIIKGYKYVVLLDINIETALERVRKERPLLKIMDEKTWVKLQKERKKLFERLATDVIHINTESIEEVAEIIKKRLNKPISG